MYEIFLTSGQTITVECTNNLVSHFRNCLMNNSDRFLVECKGEYMICLLTSEIVGVVACKIGDE